jgi:hypothetical protein
MVVPRRRETSRLARAWDLTSQSFGLLRHNRRLIWLPAISGSIVLALCAAFLGGFWMTGHDPSHYEDWRVLVADVALYVTSYTVTFFFQAALVAGALEAMAGGSPTFGSALRAASRQWRSLLVWGLVAGTVGASLRAIQERSELAGRLVAGAIGIGWSLATYFMVPVLVMESEPIPRSLRRSAELFRKTWGETLAGGARVGMLTFVAIVVIVVVSVGIGLLVHPFAGYAVGLPLLASTLVVSSAVDGIYVGALYRFAALGERTRFFREQDLVRAFAKRSSRKVGG